MLGDTVPFMQIELKTSSFVKWLGIETNPSTEALLKALVHAQENNETNLTNVFRLYSLINQTLFKAQPRAARMSISSSSTSR